MKGLDQARGRGPDGWAKSLMDRLGAALGLLAGLPLLAAVAAAVFVSLGRPIYLRQRRLGRGGVPFAIHSMR